jgi:hypothetical protein
VSTKSISTSIAHSACDVCGRTLLRGERAEVYVSGGARQTVCELCTPRALHGGWVREGTVPDYEERGARVDRRRSLLSRFRGWREAVQDGEPASPGGDDLPRQPAPRPQSPPAGVSDGSGRNGGGRKATPLREPRHVRAVPTSTEHKISSAVALFNSSEHPRTVAGIARSLGLPEVSVLPAPGMPSAVGLLLAWELCWYRYEVDLSDEIPSVRVAGQGYELDELEPGERQPNAVADDRGMLSLA